MNRKDIEETFPELNEIKDMELRDKVIEVWLLAIEESNFKDLAYVPFTLTVPTKTSLIEHTRRVTQMAMAAAKVRTDLNYDVVVAGGLCHDVGKLLEYEERNGKITKSYSGELVRHPVSGYGLAVEVGMPVEVCHIIAAHSDEGEKVKRTPEAILIHHCDFIDFDIEKSRIK
jgi:putative nucleotidyltransferase with HDIG domain